MKLTFTTVKLQNYNSQNYKILKEFANKGNVMNLEENLFSLQRNTRQTPEDMYRELGAFRKYWVALNEEN